MKMPQALVVLLWCLVLPCSVPGQTAPTMPEPGKQHQWLQQFVGEWKTDSQGTMGPGQPPIDCKGTLTSKSLGGFWVLNDLKMEMMGDKVNGVQTIGYDEAQQKYIGTWVDSATAFMWQYVGTVDASGKVLTLEADGPNFLEPGKLTKFQDIYEFKSADEILMTSRMLGADGKWVTFMSGKAQRVK